LFNRVPVLESPPANFKFELRGLNRTLFGDAFNPCRVRRATLEDLEMLTALWTSMKFSAADLKNRLIEFQVAEDAGGKVAGRSGFRFSNGRA
jgi:hypothetical protein